MESVSCEEHVTTERTSNLNAGSETREDFPVTFGPALDAYLAAGGEARYVTAELRGICNDKPLKEIDQAWIDHVASVLKPDVGPATQGRQIHTVISATLKFAASLGWCRSFRIKRPLRCERPAVQVPSLHELRVFMGLAGPSLKRIIKFKLDTDASEYEILTLDWTAVNLAHRIAQLKREDGTIRGVSFGAKTAEMLARLPHRDGRVFRCDDGRPYRVTGSRGGRLKTAFAGTVKRSGVHVSFRTLHYLHRRRRAALKRSGEQ
ncbi:hypothetical protein [Bradyrhizobium sp. CCBAU 53338]|uniref:hypothetical protein n=1 Tax=Bradyrhizobium sp. CCBAU 53338 TaxID=1325111 RepID=UPI00188C770B|nr:hypothetical protein [Bradyrhizobium sp. CCBAU 53338]